MNGTTETNTITLDSSTISNYCSECYKCLTTKNFYFRFPQPHQLSQNHRHLNWKGPLEVILCSLPLKAGWSPMLDQATCNFVQPGLENLQEWGQHKLSAQPAPLPDYPHGEKVSPNLFFLMSIASHPPTVKILTPPS